MNRRLTCGALLASLLCGESALAADTTKALTRKIIKVPAVQIAYKNDRMNEPFVIKREDQNPGVVVGDSLNFSATGSDLPSDSSRYTWSGAATGQGIAKSVIYTANGQSQLTLSVLDKNSNTTKSFTATTRARFIGPEREQDICPSASPSQDLDCGRALYDASLADDWAESGDMGARLGFGNTPCTADDGKCNAAKHSYWNLLMVRDTSFSFAARIGMAHERFSNGYFVLDDSGIDSGSAHNSAVMDLDNNAAGRSVFGTYTNTTSFPNHDERGKTELVTLINLGLLTMMDPLPNPDTGDFISSSFLVPSNTIPNQ